MAINEPLRMRLDFKEDAEAWEELLRLVKRQPLKDYWNIEGSNYTSLYRLMQWFQSMGTRLKPTESGGYVLRPDIDETGCNTWKCMSDYEEARDIWLKPVGPLLGQLLGQLRGINNSWNTRKSPQRNH